MGCKYIPKASVTRILVEKFKYNESLNPLLLRGKQSFEKTVQYYCRNGKKNLYLTINLTIEIVFAPPQKDMGKMK